jgi:hypothetical protein
MDPIINQYNFFKFVKLTDEGYVEMVLEPYTPPNNGGIDQYKVFLVIGLDDEGRIKVTIKPK